MTTEEFKKFWMHLQAYYPYDFKEPSPDWFKALKDVPYEHCCNAINTRRKSYKEAPSIDDIYESATKYKGYPSLLYKAIMKRRKEVEV